MSCDLVLCVTPKILGQVTGAQVINGMVVWNPPGETGGEIIGYDVRFITGGRVIHMQEGVTDQFYTPPESAQQAQNYQV